MIKFQKSEVNFDGIRNHNIHYLFVSSNTNNSGKLFAN